MDCRDNFSLDCDTVESGYKFTSIFKEHQKRLTSQNVVFFKPSYKTSSFACQMFMMYNDMSFVKMSSSSETFYCNSLQIPLILLFT
jgi:hypothetical protein